MIAAWVLMKVVVALGRMLCRGFLRDFFSACFSCVAACGAVSAFRRLPQLRQPAAELCRADRKCARQSVRACRISQTACHTTMLWCCDDVWLHSRCEFKPVALHRCTTSQPSTDSAVVWSHNAVTSLGVRLFLAHLSAVSQPAAQCQQCQYRFAVSTLRTVRKCWHGCGQQFTSAHSIEQTACHTTISPCS